MVSLISAAEKKFLEDGISQNFRNDGKIYQKQTFAGRTNQDFRHFILETGLITQTNGSCRLKVGNSGNLLALVLII